MSTAAKGESEMLGKTIAGKYELQRVHASGVFGTVFFAHQFFCSEFVRPVAVKISRQVGLTEETALHLFGDAVILAQLMAGVHREGKQHLVPIFDMGLLPEFGGRGFLVMEHVDGAPLLSHIQSAGKIGVSSGLRYLREICQALALVHSQGIVHRDLKPDNILIDRAGIVRVVDFGLATFTDPRLGFAPGSMGTYTYMAPETIQGEATFAADVYGLGLVAYEMFSGGGPHLTASWPEVSEYVDTREHFRIKTHLQFPPLSEVHNEIRNDYRWLDDVILRCLESDVRRRFPDAGELLATIDACEKGDSPPSMNAAPAPKPPSETSTEAGDDLVTQARRLLAAEAHQQVIDLLDIHRPAEWAIVDLQALRILRCLATAYLRSGAVKNAADCLRQLQQLQQEQAVLSRMEYAAALTELWQCWRALDLQERAADCLREISRHHLPPGHQTANR